MGLSFSKNEVNWLTVVDGSVTVLTQEPDGNPSGHSCASPDEFEGGSSWWPVAPQCGPCASTGPVEPSGIGISMPAIDMPAIASPTSICSAQRAAQAPSARERPRAASINTPQAERSDLFIARR